MATYPPTSRRRPSKALSGGAELVPFVPWTKLERHLATAWRQGQHVTLIGKSGGGKTHLAIELLRSRPYVVILATKRHDPLMEEAGRGYVVVSSLNEVPLTEGGRPVHRRVLVWPGALEKDERKRQAVQARALRETLSIAERQRQWTILVDETMWLHDMLGLRRELEAQWYQARSSGISLVANAQRPTKVPRQMIAQASHLFLWSVSDKRDLEPLREIAGRVPPALVEAVLPELDYDSHEVLYVGADDGYLARTIAPPR